ncbi:MAG: thioredoxin family protein [Candidatus Azobacteroides sp.]|nr:thioredoxin family protein [Candidatus Azobacteroides sp.]
MLKRLKLFFFFFCICPTIFSQIQEPVKWKISINSASELVFTTSIQHGWHLYAMDLPEGGPLPTTFIFEKVKGAEIVGKVTTLCQIKTEFDNSFEMNIGWYDGNPSFVQKLNIKDPDHFVVEGYVDYMTCNNEYCIPCKKEFSFSQKDLPVELSEIKKIKEIKEIKAEEVVEPSINSSKVSELKNSESAVVSPSTLWQPVMDELHHFGGNTARNTSWLFIFLLCFGGGFLALLTPCVWPIIPMTISFFLKRSKSDHKKAVADAFTYGLSIILIYLALGLLITILFGASALNNLSTNAVVNLIFFALLIVFAASFFGAFDLTLPASWVNKMDSKAESTTGLLSIFFMAFTLVLVSFSCTGPIIGSLLVQAASMGSVVGPAIGMFGFGLALAIPFALFALFPSLLHDLPKSGGWLNSVKVVLGFLELALALKFLSVADLAYKWRILDREVFLVLWITIFVLLGLYLLGKIKMPHDSDLKHVSVTRLFLSIFSFAFAVYMIHGLWGAPLKAISAFSPPLYTQDFNLYNGEVHPKFYDYEEGMAYAAKNKKPVLLDFTGYGCVNCREMEAAVWSNPRVKSIIDDQYVLISLFVDDKTKLPETIIVEEYGKTVKLRTIGDKWSYLQRYKFGANAQPYYVLLDDRGMPVGPWRAYNRNVQDYIRFLQEGVKKYETINQQQSTNYY